MTSRPPDDEDGPRTDHDARADAAPVGAEGDTGQDTGGSDTAQKPPHAGGPSAAALVAALGGTFEAGPVDCLRRWCGERAMFAETAQEFRCYRCAAVFTTAYVARHVLEDPVLARRLRRSAAA